MPSAAVAVGFLYHRASARVLLHLRATDAPTSPGAWAFLGGHCEPQDGGDPVATWCREVQEEAGIILDPAQVVLLCDGTDERGVRYWDFFAEWPSTDTTLVLGEGQALEWFTLEDALALPNLAPYARIDLLRFRARLAQDFP